jgi:hypothetical protein
MSQEKPHVPCQPWRLALEVLHMALGHFLVQITAIWLVLVLRTVLLPLLHVVTAHHSRVWVQLHEECKLAAAARLRQLKRRQQAVDLAVQAPSAELCLRSLSRQWLWQHLLLLA